MEVHGGGAGGVGGGVDVGVDPCCLWCGSGADAHAEHVAGRLALLLALPILTCAAGSSLAGTVQEGQGAAGGGGGGGSAADAGAWAAVRAGAEALCRCIAWHVMGSG